MEANPLLARTCGAREHDRLGRKFGQAKLLQGAFYPDGFRLALAGGE
jgi:hypothetical protein